MLGARAYAPATATEAQAEPHGEGSKRKGKEPAHNTGQTSSGTNNPFEAAAAQQERRVKVTGRTGDPWSHGNGTYGVGFNTDSSSSSSASLEVLQKLTMDQEAIDKERTRQHEELVALKNERLALKRTQIELQREQLQLQERDRDDRIMMIDLDKLSDVPREYFTIIQKGINKLRDSTGSSKGGS